VEEACQAVRIQMSSFGQLKLSLDAVCDKFKDMPCNVHHGDGITFDLVMSLLLRHENSLWVFVSPATFDSIKLWDRFDPDTHREFLEIGVIGSIMGRLLIVREGLKTNEVLVVSGEDLQDTNLTAVKWWFA
jgi:hypothetical protein